MMLKVQFTKRNKSKHVKIHIYTPVWLTEFWLTRVIIPVFLLYEYCNEPTHYWHKPVLTTLLSTYMSKFLL